MRMRLFALDELRAARRGRPGRPASSARTTPPGSDVLAAWRTAFGDAVGSTAVVTRSTERDDVVPGGGDRGR